MKSKREIEKELWPLISIIADLSSQDRHAEYVKLQRDFQKKLGDQLHRNPTGKDLLFQVDMAKEEIWNLLSARLQLDFSFRKKNQNR